MIVQCEHCKTKFRLADDRISHGGVKVRCSKCAHVFTVARGPTEGRIEARLLDATGSERPMAPGEVGGALADDLMLPGGFPSLGGAPPTGPGLGRALGSLPSSALPSWSAPMSPPPSFGAALPPLPFDVGPPPPISRSPLPKPIAAPAPLIPAGRLPPGQSLPSVPRALLDAEAHASEPFVDIDPSTSGTLRTLADDLPVSAYDARPEPRPARPSTEIDPPRGSPFGRASTQLDPLRSPPQARAATELDPARAGKPASGAAAIKSPTFPPPPVFDPLGGGLPLQSIAPPPAPPRIPPADSDRFSLPRPVDALGSVPPDAFGGALVGGSAAQLGDLGFEPDEAPGGAKLARIELRKGLLGTAGVSTFGAANEMTTRIAAKVAKSEGTVEADVAADLSRMRTSRVVRSALVLVGLFVVVGGAVLVHGARRETYVGQPSLLGSLVGAPPPLIQGAIGTAYVEQARVSVYPLRDPRPRLVVSGQASNAGQDVAGAVQVVASMLDGDRVVAQREAPLGALMPLDALARARTVEEVDAAWARVERPQRPWVHGERRPFMVVFPELPEGIDRYTFRVDFRPALAEAARAD